MTNNFNEFLEFAKAKGKIREIEEAFENYPVEEEWHKGKIENILEVNEENENYSIYNIGDIVFVKKYTYSNGIEGKNHLFVIITQNNFAVPIENFGMLISSKIDKIKYKGNELLEKDENNNLKKDSIVKTDVIYRILDSQISFKIGQVDLDKVEDYKQKFYELNN